MDKGFLLVLLSALCFSTKAVFAKLGYAAGSDALQMLALRMAIALPAFLWLLVREERRAKSRPTLREIGLLVLLGVLGYYLSSLLDFLGLELVPASLERLVLFLYPALAVLLGALLDRRLPPRPVWAALGLCYAGLAVSLGGLPAAGGHWKGLLLVFGSTLTYALYLVGVERWTPALRASRVAAWAMTVSCLCVLAHAGAAGVYGRSVPAAAWGWGSTMAVVSTVIPTILLSMGIRRIGAGPAAIASSLGPVSTIVLARIFLHEHLDLQQGAGAALVIGGVLLLGARIAGRAEA